MLFKNVYARAITHCSLEVWTGDVKVPKKWASKILKFFLHTTPSKISLTLTSYVEEDDLSLKIFVQDK